MNRLESQFNPCSYKPKKILLVDDDKDLGWIMHEIVKEAGHRFISASTLEEGMKKFKKSKNLDMAIVDLRIEKESGLRFIRMAKAVNNKVKFIMISSVFSPFDVMTKARRLGVSHFLDKPIRAERLLDIINRNLDVGGEG